MPEDAHARAQVSHRLRAWRQLAQQERPTPTAAQDSMLRIALAAMAADPASSLTPNDRKWVIDLAQSTRPLTPDDRVKLKTPLVRWMRVKMPGVVALIEQQFLPERGAHGETEGPC